MKKILSFLLTSCFLGAAVFAGDVATFVDGGFSKDGKIYVFGQYGKTDKDFQGWAELIEVDIEKNDYVDGGYFSTKPSSVTAGKKGVEVYESLEGKSYFSLKPLGLEKPEAKQFLYICEDANKKGCEEIRFTDFSSDIESPDCFVVNVVSDVKGSGVNAKSSFFIDIEKRDADGNVIARQKVGTPSIQRKGVTGYKVEKIFCDKSGRSMIFVVEKTVEDKTGLNIRYMVEACRLNEDF